MATRAFVPGDGKKRVPKGKFAIPDGWVARGFSFEVQWPQDQEVASSIRSQFGGRRYAYSWALGQVKADIDARKIEPAHESVKWNLYSLRKRWNAEKAAIAPWWAENSKEAYSTGIADLCVALKNWYDSKQGKRKGRKVGFPKFRCRRKDQARVRFTTGVIRVEPDRRTVTLPVVGTLRSKENTRRLERLLGKGSARVLNATLSQRWGRLFVSFGCIVENPPRATPTKDRAGVDLGMRSLAPIADSDGNIIEVPNPAPLRATLTKRRRVGRQLSRRIPGSLGHSAAKAKLARLDRRCVNLRQQASHWLTTWLAATYREVVIEDLDLAAMKKSMGRRAFRRSVSDAALGQIRPQLTYKMGWRGTQPTVADHWFASSKIHHGCGCRLIEPKKLAKQLV
ncbi:MAG: IS607 family element RNA-guided endonuclease TnpB [Candidatus Dormibacteria bacterium]